MSTATAKPLNALVPWLWRFTLPDHPRTYLRRPLAITESGRDWTVACDGRTAIYVACRLPRVQIATDEEAAKLSLFLREKLPPGDNRVPWQTLCDWFGPAVWRELCPKCDGTGMHEGEPCGFCDDEGNRGVLEPVPARYGLLYGVPVDLNLCARAAQMLDAETVTVRAEVGKPILFDCDDWRIAVMPLTHVPDDPEQPLRSFPVVDGAT